MNQIDQLWRKPYTEGFEIKKAKYIRREGGPGNYKYIYEEGQGGGSKKEVS